MLFAVLAILVVVNSNTLIQTLKFMVLFRCFIATLQGLWPRGSDISHNGLAIALK